MQPNSILTEAAEFLDDLANRLDGWATESRTGGWSTHQVKANLDAANDCRRKAAEIRLKIWNGDAA